MVADPFGGVGLQSGVYRLSMTSRRASRVQSDSCFFLLKRRRENICLDVFTFWKQIGHMI